jgi:hypothetical protein
VRGADSSLLDEWESLLDPAASAEDRALRAAALAAHRATLAARPKTTDDLIRDPRAFAARVRTELHKLLLGLKRVDFAAAAAGLYSPSPDRAWTDLELQKELAPCLEALGNLDITPRSRRPDKTRLVPDGDKRWRAQQILLSPTTDDESWMLDCVIDLSTPRSEDVPLLELVRIGT